MGCCRSCVGPVPSWRVYLDKCLGVRSQFISTQQQTVLRKGKCALLDLCLVCFYCCPLGFFCVSRADGGGVEGGGAIGVK